MAQFYCFITMTYNVSKFTIMKTSRLLAYAAAGIIAGLLVENRALILRRDVEKGTNKLKKKAGKAARQMKEKIAG